MIYHDIVIGYFNYILIGLWNSEIKKHVQSKLRIKIQNTLSKDGMLQHLLCSIPSTLKKNIKRCIFTDYTGDTYFLGVIAVQCGLKITQK